MKILHLNVNDISGGAARAAFRLHKGLERLGLNSQMLVQVKKGDDVSIVGPGSKFAKGMALLRPTIDRLPLILRRSRKKTIFNLQWLPNLVMPSLRRINPDIVHLHWIGDGFLNVTSLERIPQPIVWTLHDMWPFTGGCHYAGECDAFKYQCGACPQLASLHQKDLSRWVWLRKNKSWRRLNITFAAPSRWIQTRARESSLLRGKTVVNIPNGLDLQRYRPIDKGLARDIIGLPQRKQLILFGAVDPMTDKRKGADLLWTALDIVSETLNPELTELIVFGASTPRYPLQTKLPNRFVGRLQDDISIALLYSACDVFIAPSLEDNLPNTILEAMAAGTPCVAFRTGGLPDLIDHQQNGYLAHNSDPADLARGIIWILSDYERWRSLSSHGRQKIEKQFSLHNIARVYAALYQKLMV